MGETIQEKLKPFLKDSNDAISIRSFGNQCQGGGKAYGVYLAQIAFNFSGVHPGGLRGASIFSPPQHFSLSVVSGVTCTYAFL